MSLQAGGGCVCSGVRVSHRAFKALSVVFHAWKLLGGGRERCRREMMSSPWGCARDTLAV